MKQITLSIFCALLLITASHQLKAQVKYTVVASGTSFTPSSLTINQGDTVQWNNASGFHNVNGTQTTYPSNPESFGNGPASAPWTYVFVFNTVGTYNYRCDVHGVGMSGTITVQATTAVNETKNNVLLNVFPNPIKEFFTINMSQSYKNVYLYSINGELVKQFAPSNNYYINDLSKGVYILSINIDENNKIDKKIIIE